MNDFIADASVTLAWVFEDEASLWTQNLFEALEGGSQIHVPAHWPNEMLNGMLMAKRRGRLLSAEPMAFWEELVRLAIDVHPPLTLEQASTVYGLAESQRLTIYDAAYLELAKRLGLPLATLDSALLRTAPRVGVHLVPAL